MKPPAVLLGFLMLSAVASAVKFSATNSFGCELPIKCLTQHDPVCGSDGTTYASPCQFEYASCLHEKISLTPLTKRHDGPCDQKNNPFCAIRCSYIYSPVCGSDHQTYSNACMLQSAKCGTPGLRMIHEGECKKSCDTGCPEHYQPVCGTNGVTYANECEMEVASCKSEKRGGKSIIVGYYGTCEASPPTDPGCAEAAMCAKIYLPLCGSDGVTYGNPCEFNAAACCNASLSVAFNGECEAESTGCAAILCPAFTQCREDDATGQAYCADVCDPDRCGEDEECHLQQVQCVRAPCPPIATCSKRN